MTKVKLTEAQLNGLRAVAKSHLPYGDGTRRPTLEALRRLGLVERHTFYVTKAYYADKLGEHRQTAWEGWMNEWYVTIAGRSALKGK